MTCHKPNYSNDQILLGWLVYISWYVVYTAHQTFGSRGRYAHHVYLTIITSHSCYGILITVADKLASHTPLKMRPPLYSGQVVFLQLHWTHIV